MSTSNRASTAWDTAYEWKAVLLLSLGFGLVGLDRWIIGPLFPSIATDLGLSYSALGSAAGALAIAWGIFSITAGNLSDLIGRRRVLIPALFAFSLMSGGTGMATGLVSIVLFRAFMGAAEGAYLPTSVAAVAEASSPLRRGRHQGIQLGFFALFGFGLAPIVATQLLGLVPSWRYVLFIVAIPGLLIATLLLFILREPAHLQASAMAKSPRPPWRELLRSRNTIFAALALVCTMSCVFVIGALVPSYLTDYLKLPLRTMGFVMSAMGWGGFLGEFLVAGASDYIGRRPATIISFVGALISTWLFFHTGPNPVMLFTWLSVLSFFGLGLTSVLTGPIATESVAIGLTSSAIGFVSGVGELFGGGIAPIISGFVAEQYGIREVYWIPLVGLTIGIALAFALKESAPRVIAAIE